MGTLAGRIEGERSELAQLMLSVFTSVGATAFDVTLLDLDGRERGFDRERGFELLQRGLARRLEGLDRARYSMVIRPRSTAAALIQLDDCDEAKAGLLTPYSFLTVKTSPGSSQAWLAVSDAPADPEALKQFRTRVRRAAGADPAASGATRIAGTFNFKAKYAPDYPLVTLGPVHAGRMITTATLDEAGLIAPLAPSLAASAPRWKPGTIRTWPDYQQALSRVTTKQDGMPNRSGADYVWCIWAAERGFTVEATAAELLEVSTKAQERLRAGDPKYALLTASKAAAAARI